MPDADDTTSPNLGSGNDDLTDAGAGPLASIADSLGAICADIRTLAATCPKPEEPGFRRHIEVLAIALGALGDLGHDTRRALNAIARESKP